MSESSICVQRKAQALVLSMIDNLARGLPNWLGMLVIVVVL